MHRRAARGMALGHSLPRTGERRQPAIEQD
jgi:hypothetical protein